MSSLPSALKAPERLSLSARVAETLRNAIAEGAWTDYLPSERRLCEMLKVSRPTIRTALSLIAKDGLIEIHQGRRNRLVRPAESTSQHQSRFVGLVTCEPVSHFSLATYQGISEMRAHLTEHGIATEFLVCPRGSAHLGRRKVEKFIRQYQVSCCLLLSVSRELQEWFSSQSVPALVLGSCHPAVKLPSLDIDYRSVCRHAAGVFLGKGHRQLALVVPSSGMAGDLASQQGFLEAVNQRARGSDARATIVLHNGTAEHITAKLDALFRSDQPPTALLVAKPQHVFAVLIYLLKHGLDVPDTVSFIARDQEYMLNTVDPPIAHYMLDKGTLATPLSRLMLQMVSQGYLTREQSLISPTYFAGGTVKQF